MKAKFNVGDRIRIVDTINWYRGRPATVVEDHGWDGLLERRMYTVKVNDHGQTGVLFPLDEKQIRGIR